MWILLAYLLGHKRGRRGRPFRESTEERQVRQAQEQERKRDPYVHELPSHRPRLPYLP